jgi:hypothetical protein
MNPLLQEREEILTKAVLEARLAITREPVHRPTLDKRRR